MLLLKTVSTIKIKLSITGEFSNNFLLVRVSRAGYIEIPAPLADNLYSGNPRDHLWWVDFTDIGQVLTFQPPLTVLPELLRVSDHHSLNRYFRKSFTELLWHRDIPSLPPQQLQERVFSSSTSRLLTPLVGKISDSLDKCHDAGINQLN